MSKKKQVIVLDGWSSKERAIGTINRLDLSLGYEVVIQEHKPKRSLDQSALYFMWCSKAAKYFSSKGGKYTKEEMHDIFRHLHLGYVSKKIGNTEIKDQLKSTTDLDKTEMCEFMTKVDVWCSEHGLLLPTPDDSEFAKQKEKNQ